MPNRLKVQVKVLLTPIEKRRLKQHALDHERPVSAIVRDALAPIITPQVQDEQQAAEPTK